MFHQRPEALMLDTFVGGHGNYLTTDLGNDDLPIERKMIPIGLPSGEPSNDLTDLVEPR